jgi:hypothetical protein
MKAVGMEKEELDPERVRIQKMAADLHAINTRKGHYMSEAKVHRWGTTEPARGPRFYRTMMRQSYENTGWCPAFYMDPPENHVAMISTGQIALWRKDMNRFEQFDFTSDSEVDFHIVQDAIDRWAFLLQRKKP